ncbi:MAG: 50S ribosomal protein L18 [Promethearchaeota archaeon]
MAKGPRYRRPFRRRVEGRTDYHKRLRLLKSRMLRCVIRATNNHISVQFIESKLNGDKILVSSHSKELLSKYGWKANTGNLPAAYLTGYLAGKRAKKQNIDEAILDLGLFYHRNRVLAAVKGVIDTELEIPHKEKFFPKDVEVRVKGSHIENYAKELKKNDPEKYDLIFSGYKKDKVDPSKMSQLVASTMKNIESKA